MDIETALTAAVPVIVALTTGIVLVIREVRKVHTIVNHQRDEMLQEIDELKMRLDQRGLLARLFR